MNNLSDKNLRVRELLNVGAGFVAGPISTSESAYTKLAGLNISGTGGTLRTQFHLKAIAGGQVVYARIYRNGVAVGTEQTWTGLVGADFTEDIAGWSAGDTLGIYGKAAFGWTAIVTNLVFYGGLV